MIERLSEEIDKRFTNWSFAGSVVDWHYFGGQVLIKDFDIVTSDPFNPMKISRVFGPMTSFVALGRTVEVFRDEPSATRMPTIEQRIEKLNQLMALIPGWREKCELLILKYRQLQSGTPVSRISTVVPVCPYRGEQTRTIIHATCKKRTIDVPVYSCGLFGGECVHRKYCEDHDPALRVCVGCPRELDSGQNVGIG